MSKQSAAVVATVPAVVKAPSAKALSKQATLAARSLAKFSVITWSADVQSAASDMVSASKRVLDLMLEARGLVDEDKAREVVRDSFAAAYANTFGCTHEEAVTAKSVKNRVSDAMAVFKAVTLPQTLPANLQHAAKACREQGKALTASNDAKGPKAKPAAVAKGTEPKQVEGNNDSDIDEDDPVAVALAAIQASLNVLRGEAESDEVLSIIAALADTVGELSEAFAS